MDMNKGITLQEEFLTPELQEEVLPLLGNHHEEIEHYKDLEINVGWGVYQKLADAGKVKIYTARRDGVLVGYAVFVITPNLHYSVWQAVQDVFYVDPGERGAMLGTKLIKFAEECLTKLEIQSIYHSVNVVHDFGPLLKRQGYIHTENIYTKRI